MNFWPLLILLPWTVAKNEPRPNIVFILTDDQDIVLGGLTPMEKTKSLIADEGATFLNAFASTPVCCPSRSSILTGLYIHSHGVINNSLHGGCSSPSWQSEFEPKTYGSILKDAGYKTFYAGKYLNRYGYSGSAGGTKHIPKGWDWWIGLVGNSVYYNYSLSVNGTKVSKGDKEEDYLTDVLKQYSLEFLKHRSVVDDSFLMVVSTPSAHAPFTPANRYKGKFSGLQAPRTPNFNIPVNKTKHWLLRLPPSVLPPETVDRIDEIYRNRWETLLSVDDLVEEIILELDRMKVLNNTYLVFSSDHGYHFGQFGLPWDKRQPYETDIRVPLLVRGPAIPSKKTILDPVLSIDFAPTFLDMAGIESQTLMDGVSFLSKANELPNNDVDRTFLIEYHGEFNDSISKVCSNDSNLYLCFEESSCKCQDVKNNTYSCVRHFSNKVDDIYCKFEDDELFLEYYDMKKDPYQMENLALGRKRLDRHEKVWTCCQEKIANKMTIDDCFLKKF